MAGEEPIDSANLVWQDGRKGKENMRPKGKGRQCRGCKVPGLSLDRARLCHKCWTDQAESREADREEVDNYMSLQGGRRMFPGLLERGD